MINEKNIHIAERAFCFSLFVVLFISSCGKLALVFQGSDAQAKDLLLGFPRGIVLSIAASLELLLCTLLIYAPRRVWATTSASLGAAFLWYRFGSWWIGDTFQPCACLGLLRDRLSNYWPHIEMLLSAFAVYMMLGGIFFLRLSHHTKRAGRRHFAKSEVTVPLSKSPGTMIAFVILLSWADVTASSASAEFKASGILTYSTSESGGALIKRSSRVFSVSVLGNHFCIETGPDANRILSTKHLGTATNSFKITRLAPVNEKTVRVKVGPKWVDLPSAALDKYPGAATTIIAFPWAPPAADWGLTLPLWLGFCSQDYLNIHSKKHRIDSVSIASDGIREASIEVPAEWKLSTERPFLPISIMYLSDGKKYSFENGELIAKNVARPFPGANTNLMYQVLTWTNIANLQLPQEFELTIFDPLMSVDKKTPELKVTAYYHGHLTNVTTLVDADEIALHIPERARIVEKRFSRESIPVIQVAYTATNGQLLDLESVRKLPEYQRAYRESVQRIEVPLKRFAIYTVFGVIVIFPGVVLIAKRQRSGSRGESAR
jgi:hypothetical protein